MLDLTQLFRGLREARERTEHLRRGRLGERAARNHLKRLGMKLLASNFKGRGETDLIFRDGEVLVFVEVKARSNEDWVRPARAVDLRKQRLLTQTALDYLRLLRFPAVNVRFDIVEVLLREGRVREVRHLPNAFRMTPPHRYG